MVTPKIPVLNDLLCMSTFKTVDVSLKKIEWLETIKRAVCLLNAIAWASFPWSRSCTSSSDDLGWPWCISPHLLRLHPVIFPGQGLSDVSTLCKLIYSLWLFRFLELGHPCRVAPCLSSGTRSHADAAPRPQRLVPRAPRQPRHHTSRPPASRGTTSAR